MTWLESLPLRCEMTKFQVLSFFEEDNGKAINSTISVRTRVRPPLFIFNMNSLLLSNWATCDNCEMIWKDTESIFQRGFHGHPRRCTFRPTWPNKIINYISLSHISTQEVQLTWTVANQTGFCIVCVTFTRCSTVSWGWTVAQTCTTPYSLSTRFTTGRPSTPGRPICYN